MSFTLTPVSLHVRATVIHKHFFFFHFCFYSRRCDRQALQRGAANEKSTFTQGRAWRPAQAGRWILPAASRWPAVHIDIPRPNWGHQDKKKKTSLSNVDLETTGEPRLPLLAGINNDFSARGCEAVWSDPWGHWWLLHFICYYHCSYKSWVIMTNMYISEYMGIHTHSFWIYVSGWKIWPTCTVWQMNRALAQTLSPESWPVPVWHADCSRPFS